MKCEALRDQVVELVLGELGERARADCEEHLGGCAACRRERDEAARVLAAARAAETADPGDAFWEGFADRVFAQIGATPEPAPGLAARVRALVAARPWAWGLGLAGAAAAAALAAAAAGGLFTPPAAPGTAAPDVALAPASAIPAPDTDALGAGDADALFADDDVGALDDLGDEAVARLADALGREIEDQAEDAAAAVDGVDASDVHDALEGASADELRAIDRALEKVSIDDLG
jgi:hypothetical protein